MFNQNILNSENNFSQFKRMIWQLSAPSHGDRLPETVSENVSETKMQEKAFNLIQQWACGFNSEAELKEFANEYYHYRRNNEELWAGARSSKTREIPDEFIEKGLKSFSKKEREVKLDNIEIKKFDTDVKGKLSLLSEMVEFQRNVRYDERFEKIEDFNLGNDIGYIMDVTTSVSTRPERPILSRIIFDRNGKMIMGYFDIKE